MRQRTHELDQGFSLMELLAVLVLMSLSAALVMPDVWHRRPDAGLQGTALDMAASMRAARAKAISSNASVGFFIDVEEREYWTDGESRRRAIPQALAIDATLPARGQLRAGRGVFVFAPDGSSSGGAIVLSTGAQRATLSLDWLTGAAEVSWQL